MRTVHRSSTYLSVQLEACQLLPDACPFASDISRYRFPFTLYLQVGWNTAHSVLHPSIACLRVNGTNALQLVYMTDFGSSGIELFFRHV